MGTYTYIATATMGLESIVTKEVQKLGYETTVENGKVIFEGDELALCRANLWLRTADRVKLKIGGFTATSFEELFEGTKALPWEAFIPVYGTFPVVGRSVKSQLYSVPDCQRIVKKAVVERLKQTYNQSWFSEDGPLFKIEVALLKDEVTLTLDTTGDGLHKRGYRRLHGEAPLKETLAAAMIHLTNWQPDSDMAFLDPFSGSGTIPIEAALMAKNIAPGIQRGFQAEQWPFMNDSIWAKAREEARDLAQTTSRPAIYGSDRDEKMTALASENATLAGVGEIEWKTKHVKDLRRVAARGVLVCNPPYGTRMEERDTIQNLYETLGRVSEKHFQGWSVYVLTANEQFEKFYGQNATKKRKLFNGNIKTDYYQFWAKKKA
ncbi:class I SAM-dependent RNA methyltransferase [Salicibibacter halophilus]|uniref:Class I SAM-dependent RNA methyltransferase n=1 Tax=Salicibibacter halophilus TaxID=2502791 RepID=A0A514LDX3_9BACI|nr:class I SAM-dependent RNA methyltransferase [Salicibibacter halophilus]QDI90049.1 class I SAM-dependent RNA methyltransferase [Salicibibacter halophilus]